MGSYKIVWEKRAVKELRRLPDEAARRILQKVSELSDDPYAGKVLKGNFSEYLRVRIGAYRVIYRIEGNELRVFILRVGHRKDVYEVS